MIVPKRTTRKANREDISAIFAFAGESMKTGCTEFIRRAVDSGDAHLLEEEGKVIAVGVLEYTFFEHGFISLVLSIERAPYRSRRDAFQISDLDLPYSKNIFLDQSQQRPDAGAVWKGRLRKERHNPQPRPRRSRTHLLWDIQKLPGIEF